MHKSIKEKIRLKNYYFTTLINTVVFHFDIFMCPWTWIGIECSWVCSTELTSLEPITYQFDIPCYVQ